MKQISGAPAESRALNEFSSWKPFPQLSLWLWLCRAGNRRLKIFGFNPVLLVIHSVPTGNVSANENTFLKYSIFHTSSGRKKKEIEIIFFFLKENGFSFTQMYLNRTFDLINNDFWRIHRSDYKERRNFISGIFHVDLEESTLVRKIPFFFFVFLSICWVGNDASHLQKELDILPVSSTVYTISLDFIFLSMTILEKINS